MDNDILTPREMALRRVEIADKEGWIRLNLAVTRMLGEDPREVVRRAELKGLCGMAKVKPQPEDQQEQSARTAKPKAAGASENETK